mgnify:CR=1 FL=1
MSCFDCAAQNQCLPENCLEVLQILPRIRNVWSIGKPLYRYIRHGHGLSNYVQSMDYTEAGKGFEAQIAALEALLAE